MKILQSLSLLLIILSVSSIGWAAPSPVAISSKSTDTQNSVGDELASRPTVNGLYPLWENTGELHPRWGVQIGYNYAQLSFGRLQLGTQPFLDFYQTANGQLKISLYQGRSLKLSFGQGYYYLPTAAEGQQIGHTHSAKVVNYEPIHIMPSSLSATWIAHRRFRFHTSLTILGTWSDGSSISPSSENEQAQLDRTLSAGLSTLSEIRVNKNWSVLGHLGTEGVGIDTATHVALSFAYRTDSLDLRAGYGRTYTDGQWGNIFMYDFGLVF